jgi:hypothetical protein
VESDVTAGLLELESENGSESEAGRFGVARSIGRTGLTLAALAGIVLIVVTRRRALTTALASVGHAHWLWVPIAIGLEGTSMATFALMQRQALGAGGERVHGGPVLLTIMAANAISVSVPVAGPGLGTSFTFRRFKKLGSGSAVVSWALLVGGAASWLGAVAVLLVGGAVSGNLTVTAVATLGGLLALAGLFALRGLLTRSLASRGLERAIARISRFVDRLTDDPTRDSASDVGGWLHSLKSLRLSRSEWGRVGVFGLANWLADVGVLAVSLIALGAPVPWRDLLLVYVVAIFVGSLGITPGGIGLVEGTLCVGLVTSGVPAPLALPAVLLYRLISFWLVTTAGWLVLLYLRLEEHIRPASLPSLASS